MYDPADAYLDLEQHSVYEVAFMKPRQDCLSVCQPVCLAVGLHA